MEFPGLSKTAIVLTIVQLGADCHLIRYVEERGKIVEFVTEKYEDGPEWEGATNPNDVFRYTYANSMTTTTTTPEGPVSPS